MNEITLKDQRTLEGYRKKQLNDFFEYSKKSKSENSIRAYRFAWKKFNAWCEEHSYSIDAPPNQSFELLVGLFVCSMAKERALKPASLTAYLAGLKHFYAERGVDLDTHHREIRNAMSGIRREQGTAQVKKLPLNVENIRVLVDSMQESESIPNVRDRALILIGFAGAFRRSELVGIDIEHLDFGPNGVSVYLPSSKTDQEGQGRFVDIPFASNEKYCPVRALKSWISNAGIEKGPVFLQLKKAGKIIRKRLGDYSVALILKKRCAPFGFSNDISGHSLRAGHVTSSIKRGTSETWIMRQTGHKSVNTLRKYERMHREFEANSAAAIGL